MPHFLPNVCFFLGQMDQYNETINSTCLSNGTINKNFSDGHVTEQFIGGLVNKEMFAQHNCQAKHSLLKKLQSLIKNFQKLAPHRTSTNKSEKYRTNSHRPVRAPSGAWIPDSLNKIIILNRSL